MAHQARTREISSSETVRDARREATTRPTIGLLVAETSSLWGQSLLQGVTDAAEALDVNLLCFVSSTLPGENVEDGKNIFDLIDPDFLDGIIVSGNIAYATKPETLHAFIARLRSVLPLVGIVMVHEGLPSVLVDGFSGMYAMIKHLIEVHGCRRLAFIRGPVGNFDADERYRAYTTLLEEYGIPFNPDLVEVGNFTEGRAAMKALWPRMMAIAREEGETTPWAVVSANDDMAIQAIETLRSYGVHIPEDVLVVGFDDTVAAQNLDVPLTTARQPTPTMGRLAVELMVQRLRGEAVPERVMVPAEMIVRRSCGCLPEAVLQIPVQATMKVTGEPLPVFTGVPEPLWNAFMAAVNGQPAEGFLTLFDQALRQTQYESQRLADWQFVLTEMRRHTLTYLSDPDARGRAENLFQQARLLVGEAERQQEAYRRQRFERQETLLSQIDNTLRATLHLPELASALNGLFPAIGIECCFASLYDARDAATQYARLLFAYDTSCADGAPQVELYTDGPLFPSQQLVPRKIVVEEHRRTLLVIGLALQEQQLGFMVVWGGPQWQVYPRLAQRLSDVIFRATLMREQERARHEALEAERRAEESLRDALVAQRRYVHGAWQERAEPVGGYMYSPDAQGVTDSAWLPEMTDAVQRGDVVVTQDSTGGQTLAVPVTLYGEEMIGVLGFKATDAVPWSEEHITLVRTIAAEVALALETQRLLSEVQRRASRLLAAAEISRVATSILTLDELLPQAVNLIRERFDLYYAGIFLVDEDRRWAVLRAGTGEAGRMMLERNHRLEVGGASMIGMCVAQGEARITFDTRHEAIHRHNPLLPDTRSELALPLFSRGRVIGAMTIQDTRPGAFTREDITTLQTMADQLANAIENAMLLRRMEQNMHELEAASGRLTRESWQNFLANYRRTFGYRYRLIDVEPTHDLSPVAQTALEQQVPVVTTVAAESEDGRVQGALSVPLRVRNEVIGVLDLRFENAVVSPEAISLVEEVAARLGSALESARLLEESRRAAAREQTTARVTSSLRERLEMDAVLKNAARELRAALDLSRVAVRLAPPMTEGTSQETNAG
ncbi:MAG TPA: substrate-binding domain-containing protein [Anaerolineae bacterium]|nr:substrate-binding domain-containing protein [Anaerolineae bacterium]HQH37076.1 substrate-binding domain-containing protein [Anaerolineae bacterium]